MARHSHGVARILALALALVGALALSAPARSAGTATAVPGAPAAAPAPDPAAPKPEHAVVLKDGTVLPCIEVPVVALGRVLFRTPDGARRALPVASVNLELTKARVQQAQPPPSPAPTPPRAAAAGNAVVRRAAPDFTATTAAGKDIKLSDLKGKVVLVDFWATWCGPCVMEMPHVKALAAKHAKNDFAILGVSLDHERAKLDAFIKAQGLTWPQAYDGKGWQNGIARMYGVHSIPMTVIVDREGLIARVGVRGDTMDAVVAELLAEKKPGVKASR